MTVLRGERVELHDYAPEHEAALLRIHNTPEVLRRWGDPADPYPEADEENRVFTIFAGGEIAGLIQYWWEIDPEYRHAGIDIYVDPARHRQGIGADAIRTVMRHLIEDVGHHRITIDPELDNVAAVRCYESAGFRPVGVLEASFRNPEGRWSDVLLMEHVVGGVQATLRVLEGRHLLWFTFEDLLRFNGHHSPGGVALAFKAMELALDGLPQRRAVQVATAFGGPGARDAFECVLRAVSDGRYVVDPALERPSLGPERAKYVFRVGEVELVLNEGFVVPEFTALLARERDGTDNARLEVLKAELAERVMAAPADAVFAAPFG